MIAYFNRFQIEMTLEEAKGASSPGQDADPVVSVMVKLPKFQSQFRRIPEGLIQLELKEYGAWDDGELMDAEQNQKRILWIAACNIREEKSRG